MTLFSNQGPFKPLQRKQAYGKRALFHHWGQNCNSAIFEEFDPWFRIWRILFISRGGILGQKMPGLQFKSVLNGGWKYLTCSIEVDLLYRKELGVPSSGCLSRFCIILIWFKDNCQNVSWTLGLIGPEAKDAVSPLHLRLYLPRQELLGNEKWEPRTKPNKR